MKKSYWGPYQQLAGAAPGFLYFVLILILMQHLSRRFPVAQSSFDLVLCFLAELYSRKPDR